MLPRERMECALNFIEPDRPPHFEQVFDLTEETFGLKMPEESDFEGVTGQALTALFERCAHIYALIIERFSWDAVIVWRPAMEKPTDQPDHPVYAFIPYLKKYLRNHFGYDIPVGAFVWQSFISLDTVKDYMEFSIALFEEPETLDEWAKDMFDKGMLHTKRLLDAGADFINVNSDHAFNNATFLRPEQFRRFVFPYKKSMVDYIRSRGAWAMMHSDGNLMGIMDQILEIHPHFLQSIDPMAGMDIRRVKEMCHGKMALMGNVDCSLLQHGPKSSIIESADYCLSHGPSQGGYIFSTSNTVFDGIPLENYLLMLDCFKKHFPPA